MSFFKSNKVNKLKKNKNFPADFYFHFPALKTHVQKTQKKQHMSFSNNWKHFPCINSFRILRTYNKKKQEKSSSHNSEGNILNVEGISQSREERKNF